MIAYKKERDNIHRDELRFFQQVAKDLLELSEQQLQVVIATGELTELGYDNKIA